MNPAAACPHISEITTVKRPVERKCEECVKIGAQWVHLRTCQECGKTLCCDSSPNQHASKHHAETGHQVIASFEPGERWFYDYRTEEVFAGPSLAAPRWHPVDQPVPGPAGRVPPDWESLLHE